MRNLPIFGPLPREKLISALDIGLRVYVPTLSGAMPPASPTPAAPRGAVPAGFPSPDAEYAIITAEIVALV
jgi:hypothetical protein